MDRPPVTATPRKEDVKYILCDVCRSLSQALYTQSQRLSSHVEAGTQKRKVQQLIFTTIVMKLLLS